MPIAPVSRLKKSEIIWLSKHYCKHRSPYLIHYQCYLNENPKKQRVGYFDIETSNLRADFGILLCYAIKEAGENKILSGCITKKDLQSEGCLDKNLVKKCVDDLNKFDRIITHYGTNFDLPFVRTRALFWNLEFPPYGRIYHHDTYYILRNRLCLSRNRLESSCQHILGKTRKTHIDPRRWILALQGDAAALAYILDHCKRDVRDLEELYNRIYHFTASQDKSI